jgi:hypothetical protein
MQSPMKFLVVVATMWLLGAASIGCEADPETMRGRRDGATDGAGADGPPGGMDGTTGPCVDTDNDGISDSLEGAPTQHTSRDSSGPPDYQNTDSDDDGYSDRDEAARSYAGYESNAQPIACGNAPSDCDRDGIPNHRDFDSDNDGLSDREELAAHTDPCAEDSDGDMVADIIELAARSSPTDGTSRPPEGSLYVTLPHNDVEPGTMTPRHQHRQFTFSTRIRAADVFFLVDNSASMDPIINTLRSTMMTVLIPGIRSAIGAGGDVRFGVGSFDSMPDGIDGSAGDYDLWVRQALTTNDAAGDARVQAALNAMHTVGTDSPGRYGGDYPENQIIAAWHALTGQGTLPALSGSAAISAARGVHGGPAACAGQTGCGYVPAMDPAADCGATPADMAFGWACFRHGRVPIVVLFSDASWYNGPGSDPRLSSGPAYSQIVADFMAAEAFFVGVDVGTSGAGDTLNRSRAFATATGTVDASGAPVAYLDAGGDPANIGVVVTAITTLASQTRQDITTRVTPDPMETRVAAPHTTADFIKAVRPDHAIPATGTTGMGFTRMDMTTFYGVLPSTQVVFDVDFYNDFQRNTSSAAELYRATIHVLGRADSEVDHHDVYIIVPVDAPPPPG